MYITLKVTESCRGAEQRERTTEYELNALVKQPDGASAEYVFRLLRGALIRLLRHGERIGVGDGLSRIITSHTERSIIGRTDVNAIGNTEREDIETIRKQMRSGKSL